MADPFEVRMRFTTQLQHLSASTTSSLKCAHYALKHRDQDEDLHSCIIEQLERNNMNNRANIMYFLEHLCDLAGRPGPKDGHEMYVKMIERDIERIVDAVAPRDGSGAANVKVVRAVLAGLKGRGVLQEQQVEGLEEGLKGRDMRPDLGMGDDVMGDQADEILDHDDSAGAEGVTTAPTPKTTRDTDMTGIPPSAPRVKKVDKRVIEQRIEEDRERNKRLRESVWAVGSGTSPDDGGRGSNNTEEMDKMWEEGSDAGIDDLIMYGEEAAERRQAGFYAGL